MADFSPLEDYFGLNALVTRLKMSASESPCQPSYSSVARSSELLSATPKLQDFDIFKLSRVYNERANTRRRRKPLTYCVFCKNNQETERVYTSHTLRDESGATACPILRAYTCPICGSSGDDAHTIKYCPANQSRRH